MLRALTVAALALLPVLTRAAEPVLDVDLGAGVQHYERAALLKRAEVRTVNVADDVAYADLRASGGIFPEAQTR